MVARQLTENLINRRLQYASAMLGELREQADRWEQMPDWERASWSLEWDQFVNVMQSVLDVAFCSGSMTTRQQSRYRAVLGQIRDALPVIQHLNLQAPNVAFDAAV